MWLKSKYCPYFGNTRRLTRFLTFWVVIPGDYEGSSHCRRWLHVWGRGIEGLDRKRAQDLTHDKSDASQLWAYSKSCSSVCNSGMAATTSTVLIFRRNFFSLSHTINASDKLCIAYSFAYQFCISIVYVYCIGLSHLPFWERDFCFLDCWFFSCEKFRIHKEYVVYNV